LQCIGEYISNVPEAGDRTPRIADEELPVQRRSQGSAVAALNAFTASVSSDGRDGLGFQAPDDALRELAAAVNDGTLRVPRLFVLDSLVKFARRRGEDLRANDTALDELLMALVGHAGVPLTAATDAAAKVRRALDSVSRISAVGPVGDSWSVFTQQAAGALRLTQAEIEKPLCNDREVVHKGSYEAVAVTVEFHTDAAPYDLRHFCDPTRWHECSAYQREMTPWDGPGAVDRKQGDGWRRDLYETVDFSPAKTLVTPLRFTYSAQAETDPSWVHLDYVLLAKTEDIVVDEGALDVRRVTSGKHKGRTRVTAKKAILFTDPVLKEWPTIACDTFWTDLVIAAAVGCPDDGGASPTQRGAKMADAQPDKLEQAIEEATKSAQASVAAYAGLAKEAAAQLAADAPADAGTWLQLTAKVYAQAAADTATAATTYNDVLKILANQAEPTTYEPTTYD
jgi:hypothetical protein